MDDSIAWKNGHWLPKDQVHLELNDWGVLQGVMIVDRLRTVKLAVLDLAQHMQRLESNCRSIGIPIDSNAIAQVVETCVARNRASYAGMDFSVVVLITPGIAGTGKPDGNPTAIVHTQAINWSALTHWYTSGQAIFLAPNRNVPAACWSPHLKTRARLQYYLADQFALTSGLPYAGAVLMDTDGFLTETSVANLVLVLADNDLVVPPATDTLEGISLSRTLRLAHDAGLNVTRRPISMDDVGAAREVLLTGTTGCLWPAKGLVNKIFTDPIGGEIYQVLRKRWSDSLDLDYVDQAIRFSQS